MFLEKLHEASRRNRTLLCVGLDPDPELAPDSLRRGQGWPVTFLQGIVDATADLVCAYKLNLAFFEAMGATGWSALRTTIGLIPKHIPIIADAKRGDIGNTARAYARSLYEDLGADAATVSPYLGSDSIQPFFEYPGRTAFILCRTSNPGARDFQDLLCQVGERTLPLYQAVAERVVEWQARGSVGLVVGATYPRELAAVRAIAPELPLLVPAIGPQGGDLTAAVQAGVDARGEMALISASRQVLYASRDADWADAARSASEQLRHAINEARSQPP